MSHPDWIDRLVLALLYRDVDGSRVGEIVTEIETYLADSGVDPWTEFGDPGEFAESLTGRTGPTQRTKIHFATFLVVSCIGWLALFGLFAAGHDGPIPVVFSYLVAGVLFTIGMVAFFLWLVESTGPVWEGKRRPQTLLQFTAFWVVEVVAVVTAIWLPQAVVFEMPANALWPIAIISFTYVVVESIRMRKKGRIKAPSGAPPEGEDAVRRWTGLESWRTGWQIGRDVFRGPGRD